MIYQWSIYGYYLVPFYVSIIQAAYLSGDMVVTFYVSIIPAAYLPGDMVVSVEWINSHMKFSGPLKAGIRSHTRSQSHQLRIHGRR